MEPVRNAPSDEGNEACSNSSSTANLSEETEDRKTIRRDGILDPLSTPSDSKLEEPQRVGDEKDESSIQASEHSSDECTRSSMNQALKSERAFIEYVMSLPSTPPTKESRQLTKSEVHSFHKPKSRSSVVTTSSTNTTKVGLDHLDNLCKLMEQLSELRETNAKLQKRVQYLEDLKTLHEMHNEIRSEAQYGSENILTQRRSYGLKKSLTSTDYIKSCSRGSQDYVIGENDEYVYKEQRPTKNPHSPSVRRSRPLHSPAYDGQRRERSKSVGHEEVFDGKSKRIFPKWSKVKEAFGWESERKTQAKPNKFYFVPPTNEEQYFSNGRRISTEQDLLAFRIPLYSDYCKKDDISHIDSYAGEAMAACGESCGQQFNSSVEDIAGFLETYRATNQFWKRESAPSEKRLSLLEAPSEGLRRQKSTPSPGSDKIRSYHEMLDLKPKSLTIERDIDPEQAFAKYDKEECKKPHKSPWGRVKTIIERRRDSLKRRQLRRIPPQGSLQPHRFQDPSALDDTDFYLQDASPSNDSQRKSSDDQYTSSSSFCKETDNEKFSKRKRQTPSTQYKELETEKPRHSNQLRQPISNERSNNIDSRVPSIPDREVMFRTPGSSPQLQRKSTWMKMKNVLRNKKEGENAPAQSSQSMPSSPNGVHDATFDFEDTEGLEDNTEESECFDNGQEIARVGSDSYVHKLSLSASVPVTNIMLELQRNISDDFNRKMQEWERIRKSGVRPITSPKWERKNSGSKVRKKSEKGKVERLEKPMKPKIKDLTWLEKELQKIEKEKQRLTKEKEKYEERAVRLERLRQTVLTARNSNKKEVLVRTSAGEFRFEGISDAFTKKLYEWETKRGLGPELSTIALLDSSIRTNNRNCLTIQPIDNRGNLQRGLSRSESSIAEINQPSHTSSNSLPSLKPPEIGDLERIHHSRANSEPDLSSYTGMSNSATCVPNTFPNQSGDLTAESSGDTLGTEPRESYVHPEVTQLIDSDVEEVLGEIESRTQEQRDENYYSLLEENVILLEQLKNKEEICRRLEKELELLDEKVDEMNKHHQQEMERYREKLWEMHKPDSTPREVQGCLQVMVELRSRIENLEKCSEKLKSEKETLEDSFRFHSAEQEHMTLDLLEKMRELHAAGIGEGEKQGSRDALKKEKGYPPPNFDIKIVERLQDLSTQLVKQTRELEQALAERTRQICQLRWELLHRDVSTVKLETELHKAHIQGVSSRNRVTCDDKRAKYAHFRSWSSEEASNRSKELQECPTEVRERPKAGDLPEAYYKLPNTEFQASELSNTVHELNRELIRLSTAATESFTGRDGSERFDENAPYTTKEMNENGKYQLAELSKNNEKHDVIARIPQPSCNDSITLAEQTDTRNAKISVRRNSVGSISITSGIEPGGSESSSINDESNRHVSVVKPSSKPYHKLNYKTSWSDSDSTTEEETFTRVSFLHKPEISEAGQDIILNQASNKRKGFNLQDNDERHNVKITNEEQALNTKRKINYKALKAARKLYGRNGQFSLPNEFTIRQSNSAQSESDSAVNIHLEKGTQDRTSNRTIQPVPTTASRERYFLRLCQSADQVTPKPVTRGKSDPTRKVPLRKDHSNRPHKSHSVRASSSFDSKIPRCTQIGIRKSESCHEGSGRRKEILKDHHCNSRKTCEAVRAGRDVSCKSNAMKNTELVKLTSTKEKQLDGAEWDQNLCSNDQSVKASVFNQNKIPDTSFAHNENNLPRMNSQHRISSEYAKEISHSAKLVEKYLGNDVFDATSSQKQSEFPMKQENRVSEAPQTIESSVVIKLPRRKSRALQKTCEKTCDSDNFYNKKPKENQQADNIAAFTVTQVNVLKEAIAENVTENESHLQHSLHGETKSALESNCTYFIGEGDRLHLNDKKLSLCNEVEFDMAEKRKLTESLSTNSCNFSFNEKFMHHATNNENFSQKTGVLTSTERKNSQEESSIKMEQDGRRVDENKENCSRTNDKLINIDIEEAFKSTKATNREREFNKVMHCVKSPSAPQLDWKKSCAKKISKQDAPNVKTLIEKYNQKVWESQFQSPCSSSYNSPAITRKAATPQTDKHDPEVKNIPFCSSLCPSKIIPTSSVFTPMVFKPTNLDLFQSPTSSPPTSPSSKARSEALLKAKEIFISSSSIFPITTDNLPKTKGSSSMDNANSVDQSFCIESCQENGANSTKRSATDSEITKQQNCHRKVNIYDKEDNRKSICSTKSSDSMNLVLCKTGETCQESRFLRRCDKQKAVENQFKEEQQLKATKSLSTSSVFKTVTGHDIKLPSSFLRLRRSRKKKDMSTVSQLCRQSLLLEPEEVHTAKNEATKSAVSCPSSPELKSKERSKPSWFQRNLFRMK